MGLNLFIKIFNLLTFAYTEFHKNYQNYKSKKAISISNPLFYKFVYCKNKKKMKKNSRQEFLNREQVNEMIESAIRRHNRRSTIISSVLGWILIGGYSFGLFQAVQNV